MGKEKEHIVVKAGRIRKLATFKAESANTTNRTIDVIFATDAPIINQDWRINDGKPFYEVLSFDEGHIRKARAEKGLAVFKDHMKYADNKIGKGENVMFSKSDATATVRFSQNEESFFKDVVDGIQAEVSGGFNVYKYEDISEPDAKVRTFKAIDWEPTEISFVGVQADIRSTTRSEEDEHEVIIIQNKRNLNPDKNNLMAKSAEEIARIKASNAQIRATRERKQQEALEAAKIEGARAQKELTDSIFEVVRKAKLPETFATEILAVKDITIDKARQMVIDKFAEEGSKAPTQGAQGAHVGVEQVQKVTRAISNALTLRVDPTCESEMKPEEVSAAREFRNMSLIETAKEYLGARGIETRGLSKREVAQLSFERIEGSRAMAIGDFPILLEGTFKRSLRKAYEMTEATYKPFVSRGTMPDFREMSRAQLSGLVGAFDVVTEGGEYKLSSLTEAKETYKLVKYGKKIAFTWESMINDDLSAFKRVPQAIANEASQKKSDIIYGLLSANAAMSDGFALFSANHGNLGSAGVPSETTLSAARLAMRNQKDLNGRFINVMAQTIVVGPSLETTTQKLLQATIIATKTSDTNIFKGSLNMAVEPRITDNSWYLFANPQSIDIIEESFLEGEPDLFTETKYGFDVDGMEMKARMVYAAKAIDWRGAYKVPNA